MTNYLNWRNLFIVLLAIALLISVFLINKKQEKLHQLEAQLAEHNKTNTAVLDQNKKLQTRILADEAFINQDFEKAYDLYAQANSSGKPDSGLLNDRKLQAGKLQQETATLNEVENQLSRLKQKITDLNETNLQANQATDSLSQYNLLQQTIMTQAFERQQQAIDSLQSLVSRLQNKKDEKVLEFINEKGNKVFYVGEKNLGQANGYGVGLWETGGKYAGNWENNQRHGKGAYHWADGERYEGNYENDMREGFGTYFFKNGDKYVGNWKADMRHGTGIIYDSNGKVKFEGEWSEDVFKQSKNTDIRQK